MTFISKSGRKSSLATNQWKLLQVLSQAGQEEMACLEDEDLNMLYMKEWKISSVMCKRHILHHVFSPKLTTYNFARAYTQK